MLMEFLPCNTFTCLSSFTHHINPVMYVLRMAPIADEQTEAMKD